MTYWGSVPHWPDFAYLFPYIFSYAIFHEKEPVKNSTPVKNIKPRSMAFLKGD